MVGAEDSDWSRADRENQTCVREKKTKGGAGVKSTTQLGKAEEEMQQFPGQVNVDV